MVLRYNLHGDTQGCESEEFVTLRKVCIENPVDMHVHVRDKEMLKSVLPFTSKYFSAALVMPNLIPPLTNADMVGAYKQEILNNSDNFEPIMSMYLSDELTQDEIERAKRSGIKVLKLYPKGSTTNSESGIKDVLSNKMLGILELAQNDFILSVHGESNGFSMDREFEFSSVIKEIARAFPSLRIVIEHVSDRRSIELIHSYDNLFGTITPHHMLLTLDDVLGKNLNPFHFCKPVLKTPMDRDAILRSALSGDNKFSFGSDSAPHTIESKTKGGAAGIFNAPILLELLTDTFAKYDRMENLQSFVSDNAIRIYGLDIKHKKHVILSECKHEVRHKISCRDGDIAVFFAGRELNYTVDIVQ